MLCSSGVLPAARGQMHCKASKQFRLLSVPTLDILQGGERTVREGNLQSHLLRLPILLLVLVICVLLVLWLLLLLVVVMVRVLLLLAILLLLLLLLLVMLLLHLVLRLRGWRWRGAQVLGLLCLLGPLCFGCLYLFFGSLQAKGNPAYVCILHARPPVSTLEGCDRTAKV